VTRDQEHAESSSEGTQLPLQFVPHGRGDRWSVRLPLRAETVEVRKQAFVYERVSIATREAEHVAQVGATVRHERLDIRSEGDVTVDEEQIGP